MGAVIVDMAMSLDGFAADENHTALYPIEQLRHTPYLDPFIQGAGAVVMGRKAYAMADPDGFVHYDYQVPIFVLTHAAPAKVAKGENGQLTFTFVTDGIASAIAQAKVAAGDKHVMIIGGASTAQQCLNAGLLDELQIRLLPILLGQGLRLFEHLNHKIELEPTEAHQALGLTHLRFRIVK